MLDKIDFSEKTGIETISILRSSAKEMIKRGLYTLINSTNAETDIVLFQSLVGMMIGYIGVGLIDYSQMLFVFKDIAQYKPEISEYIEEHPLNIELVEKSKLN